MKWHTNSAKSKNSEKSEENVEKKVLPDLVSQSTPDPNNNTRATTHSQSSAHPLPRRTHGLHETTTQFCLHEHMSHDLEDLIHTSIDQVLEKHHLAEADFDKIDDARISYCLSEAIHRVSGINFKSTEDQKKNCFNLVNQGIEEILNGHDETEELVKRRQSKAVNSHTHSKNSVLHETLDHFAIYDHLDDYLEEVLHEAIDDVTKDQEITEEKLESIPKNRITYALSEAVHKLTKNNHRSVFEQKVFAFNSVSEEIRDMFKTPEKEVSWDTKTTPSVGRLGRAASATKTKGFSGSYRATAPAVTRTRTSEYRGRDSRVSTIAALDSHSNSATSNKHSKYIPPSKITKSHKRVTSPGTHGSSSHTQMRASRNMNTINKLLQKNTQDVMSRLDSDVIKCFETLFDRIDISDSGGITSKEILDLIKNYTNKDLTLDEINKVLADLDLTDTGDIEFDEFIFMLSQPANYVRLLQKEDLSKVPQAKPFLEANKNKNNDPSKVFFQALRAATQRDSLTALRTYYRKTLKKLNDHVIHDWSAGQRCIGLSDHAMQQRYEAIQSELLRQRVNFCKDNSYRLSPYARPLEWGLITVKQVIAERRKKLYEEQHKRDQTKNSATRRVKMSEFVVTPKAVPLPKYVIKKRSPLKRTFNYDQLADIRVKVNDIATEYYSELKNVARDNSKVVKRELAVDEIKNEQIAQNFKLTFQAYCAPFVVSPWIPMPSPTLQASFAPLGRSKLASQKVW